MILNHYQDIVEIITKKNRIQRVIVLCIGAFIVALLYNSFVVKNNLVYGGIGGLAILIQNNFGIKTTIFINIVTLCLISLSFFLLGRKKTFYSVVGYFVYAIMINITEPIAKYINFNFDSFLFSVVIVSLMMGYGYGLIYKTGFNTGGSDTLVNIIQKYFQFPTAKLSNIINTIIILLGATTFGLTQTIYAIIFLKISNYISDRVILGVSNHKICYIKSKKYVNIEEYLTKELEIGYSLLDVTNGIGIIKRPLIFCVIPSDRFYDFKYELQDIDIDVKIASKDCYTVVGGRVNPLLSL